MKSLTLKGGVLGASLAITLLPVAPVLAATPNQTATNSGITFLNTQQKTDGSYPGFDSSTSGWAAIAYEAAGTDPATVKVSGGTSLLDYLKNNPPAAGTKVTDVERDILAITAMGQNPYDFGGVNYVSALEAFHAAGQIGDTASVNDDSFGIMALSAANVPATDTALTDALAFVLAHQHSDGGYSYDATGNTGSDVDDTAATIMALEGAKKAGLTVSAAAITNAEDYMVSDQNQDGGFPYDPKSTFDTNSNVDSTSWAIMAMTAAGLQNSQDGQNAQTWLIAQQQQDGSFPYETAFGAGDAFDTTFAVTALADGTWPLHTWDGPIPEGNTTGGQTGGTTTPSPSVSPSPSTSPAAGQNQSGQVLGDSTTAPSASADPAAGKVLGAGILPNTGTVANLLALAIASLAALTAFSITYLRSRRKSRV